MADVAPVAVLHRADELREERAALLLAELAVGQQVLEELALRRELLDQDRVRLGLGALSGCAAFTL